MSKKITVLLFMIIFSISPAVFAAESFEHNNILYNIDLVSHQEEGYSEIVLTATAYLDTSSYNPPPETIGADELYEILGYDDPEKDSTDISVALSDLGKAGVEVKKAATLTVPGTFSGSGGYTDENDIFIPESLEDISATTDTSATPSKPAAKEIKVILHGIFTMVDTTISFPDQKPVIVSGRTLVPARGVFEQLGYKVGWDGAASSAVITGKDTSIRIPLDSNTMYKNGEPQTLDVPAQMINGRTMIPLRAISRALSLQVEWDALSNSVYIYHYN